MNTQEMIHDLVDNAIKKAGEAECDGYGEENEEMNLVSQQQLQQASQQQELVKTSQAMVMGVTNMEEVEGRGGGNDAGDSMVLGSLEI